MSRFGLTLYFLFATLTGPWLCCCLVRSAPAVDASATHVDVTCCCCDESAKPEQAPHPAPTKHQCPCRAEGQPPAVVAKSTAIHAPFAQSLDTFTVFEISHLFIANDQAVELREKPIPIDLQVRLSLLSVLRC